MQKVKGVETVRVSLNEGLTILDLKPENTVTVADLRQIIKNNGFVSKESRVVVRGTIREADGQFVLDVIGSRETFVLAASPQHPDVLSRLRLKSPAVIEVIGTVESVTAGPARLVVISGSAGF